MANLSKLQAFEMMRMHRSQLTEAPYNPRQITRQAKKKLEASVKKFKLVQPIVLNKTTGHIVSGHQRLSITDALEGTPDYELDVAVVELDEKSERELNVVLNNQAAMGDFDIDKLGDLIRGGADFEAMGMDHVDLEFLFDSTELASMFSAKAEPKAVQDAVNTLEEIAEIKKRRKAFKERQQETDSAQFYIVIVAANDEDRIKVATALGIDPYEKYVSSKLILSQLEKSS